VESIEDWNASRSCLITVPFSLYMYLFRSLYKADWDRMSLDFRSVRHVQMRDVGWRAERPASGLLSRWRVAGRDLQRLHCSSIDQPKMVSAEACQCGDGFE
jgi:hypothetical protein